MWIVTLVCALLLIFAGWVIVSQQLNTFSPGQFVPALWAPKGSPFALLQIKDHNLDESCLLFDVTHSGTGGLRARIAGPIDYAGTVNADLDLDVSPYAVLVLHAGNQGVVQFNVSATRGIQIPVRIEKVHYQTAIESEVRYSFDSKLDALSGLVVFPAL